MKRLLLLLIVGCDGPGLTPRTPVPAASVSAAPTPPAPDTSRVYEDPDGQFAIRFPLPFEVDRKSEALGGGTMLTTSLSTMNDDPLYMAVKVNLDNIAAYDCAKGLDGMRDETMRQVGCKITDEKRLEMKGNPSREITFTCPKRRGVMLLACDATKSSIKRYTAYEIVASGSTMTDAIARQFTTSFTLK